VFAIDLGAIAMGDPTTPLVYREPDAFFAATYITTDLRRLLEEVLASLAGLGIYNRVLKLRSPFGGGKSHTLASLLHAGRSRKSLNQIADCKGLADPGEVAVAVFDGEKFTATGDKDVGNGQKVHTMWGWLAWQLGPAAWPTRWFRSMTKNGCRRRATRSRRCWRRPARRAIGWQARRLCVAGRVA